ncbi:MAG: hypothetical protein VKO21_10400 [Candidatus Sericytochromatia bacterium]|nr:hypothetical protein [Candidatus Sericytochromatia bacterium]
MAAEALAKNKKPAAKSAPKPAAKPAPKPAAKSAPKPAAKPAPKPAAKPAPKQEAKPVPKNEPKAKNNSKKDNPKEDKKNEKKSDKKNDKKNKKDKKKDNNKNSKLKNGNKKSHEQTKKLAQQNKSLAIAMPSSSFAKCYPSKPKEGTKCYSGNPEVKESKTSGGKKITYKWNIKVYEEPVEVVAVFRSIKKNLLKNIDNKKVQAKKSKNKKAVDNTLKKYTNKDWEELEDFVKDEIDTVKHGSKTRNTEIVLLDKKTGDIIGSVPVGDFKDGKKVSTSQNKKLASSIQKTLDNLVTKGASDIKYEGEGDSKGSEYMKVVGYTYHGSPIILDLSGRGKPDLLAQGPWKLRPGRQLAAEGLRLFDLDGQGTANWEWVGPGSGLLVWDPEHTGRITSGRQLFGNYTWGESFPDGYRALERLDQNGDGWLKGSELDKLGVWTDTDSDAVSDPGEVRRLEELGIMAISTKPERDRYGNAHAAQGFLKEDAGGSARSGASWDWISYGRAQPSEGIYVWVGTKGTEQLGGYFNLRDDAGRISGRTFPVFGPGAAENPDILVSIPIEGQVTKPGELSWTTPVPEGTMQTKVWWEDEGRHLYGLTTINARNTTVSYRWQGQLVEGDAVGQGLRFTRASEE